MLHTASLEIDVAPAGGNHLVVVHFQYAQVEVNIWLTREDSQRILAGIPLAAEGAIVAGDSAGTKAHWSRNSDGLTFVVVGHDDESWDIGLTLGIEARQELISLLSKAVE